MSEEEKKAIHDLKILRQGIEFLNCIPNVEKDEADIKAIDIILNLIQKQDTEINKLNKEKEYYKKLYNESYNFLDPKFTGDHIPRID